MLIYGGNIKDITHMHHSVVDPTRHISHELCDFFFKEKRKNILESKAVGTIKLLGTWFIACIVVYTT